MWYRGFGPFLRVAHTEFSFGAPKRHRMGPKKCGNSYFGCGNRKIGLLRFLCLQLLLPRRKNHARSKKIPLQALKTLNPSLKGKYWCPQPQRLARIRLWPIPIFSHGLEWIFIVPGRKLYRSLFFQFFYL